MARQSSRSTSKTAPAGISGKQLRRIWGDLTAPALVERLRQLQPHARWSASGHRITGCCPYHDDRSPSFFIYLDRHYGKCFGCNAFVWNPVDLWAQVKGCDKVEALNDLKQSFGLKFLTASASTQLLAWERRQQVLREIVRLSHETMMDAINDPEAAHPAVRNTVDWLLNVRKLSLTALPTFNMVGVLPPVGLIFDALDAAAERENSRRQAAGVTDLVQSLAADAKDTLNKSAAWVGALVLQYDTAPSAIGRIKLRRAASRDFIFLGEEGEELGFFGLSWAPYQHLLGPQQQYVPGIHVVEGEFDALTLMGQQLELHGGPQMVVAASGGNGSAAAIDELSGATGAEEVYLFGDAPEKNGNALIESWLENTEKLRAKVFCGWAEFPGAGDPDEAVLQYGIGPVTAAVLDLKNKTRFQTPQEWVFDRASPQLSKLDPADVRQKIEVASGWGRYLRNPHECDAYVEVCARAFDIPAASLKRQIVALDEDESAFIQRLADVLRKEFQVLGQKASDNDRKIYLWSRAKKAITHIGLADDRGIERELGTMLGPAYHFFSDKVGVPPFLEVHVRNDGSPYLQKFDASCRWYYKQALLLMANEAPEYSESAKKAQGVHINRGERPAVYVVNGRAVYHGAFDETGALTWELLDAPIHGGYTFDVLSDEPAWMKSVACTDDLYRAQSIDLRDLYDRVHALLDRGWRFKHQQTSAQFLAAHIMAASVCAAFRRQPMVGIHGESQSGKSRLLSGLISGTSHRDLHILSAATNMGTYTGAGVRQKMANTARPLALDEFEDEGQGDKKSRAVNDILEMFRNLTGEDNVITYGSRSGQSVQQSLNMFVFVAAITKARKVQDANRIIMIDLNKGRDIDDPIEVVKRDFPPGYVDSVRADLEVALLPHIQKIGQVYEDIARYFAINGNRPSNMESRYVEALQPAMTVMRLVGLDEKKFLRDFAAAHSENLIDTKTHSESSLLMDWVFQSPQIPMYSDESGERLFLSLLQVLSKPGYRRRLNSLGCGLYFDETDEVLVVNWTTAMQTVLSRHHRYSKETSTYSVRETANRHTLAMKAGELERSGVLSRLRRFGVAAMTANTLSAFRISPVLRSLATEDEPALATVAPPTSEKAHEPAPAGSGHADYF